MSFILDASAMLALMFEEEGAEAVLARCRGAIISAVNMDEVLHKCGRVEIGAADVEAILARLEIGIVPFDLVQARASARLHPALHKLGISFADRACLALAETTGRTILSADGDWKSVALTVDVQFIR